MDEQARVERCVTAPPLASFAAAVKSARRGERRALLSYESCLKSDVVLFYTRMACARGLTAAHSNQIQINAPDASTQAGDIDVTSIQEPQYAGGHGGRHR
ncbi:hypothetical protein Bphy_0108 [Paraburkholderia phymatum STM815]|uniref:Uncharacterized protein n=1 Tax=Paraburkholderia phymatum (strain DSM 17167 / CIP 108236 / LMG 21445 / STM815) TaxID=391038 RepID=B2JK15_PARP8|nr:hypothetical protein Bphy_0108 [Paraburkholderia phymatum STM815]